MAIINYANAICRICTDARGYKHAEQVQCARVYHINIVLRIRTSTQNKVSNRPYKEKSMQIQRCSLDDLMKCNRGPTLLLLVCAAITLVS